MKKVTLAMACSTLLLGACVNDGMHGTSWGGASYIASTSAYTRVSSAGGALAAVATYGGLTSVSTSAGNDTGSSVVTDGTSTAMTSKAGFAQAAIGTSGSAVGIAVSTSGASAAVAVNGNLSAGSTSAGTSTSSW
jgi:hypothetical protein